MRTFQGIIDEVRIWNTIRSVAEIRAGMCRKLTGAEGGLVAYWRFDEGTGSTAYDLTANDNDGALTDMDPVSDWVTSGAAVGDASIYDYTPPIVANLGHAAGDDITIEATAGSPAGVQIYRVDEAPNVTTPPGTYAKISAVRYWGAFVIGGTSPEYTVTYDYDGHPGITDESALRLARRDDNEDTTWEDTAATLDTGANTLTRAGESGTEYILGSTSLDNPLPVELSSFTATSSEGAVLLTWTTESEVDNLGFYLHRADNVDGPFTRLNDRIIPGAGNSPVYHEYSYVDTEVEEGNRYYYFLEDLDLWGISYDSDMISVFVQYASTSVPEEFSLLQNYPNPFNPGTWIPYQLRATAAVEIKIYDVAGHLIRTISVGRQDAGYYTSEKRAVYWNGKNEAGRTVPTGIYFYQINAGDLTETRKMVVTK